MEGKMKLVTKEMWMKMSEDCRKDALQTTFKNSSDINKYYRTDWKDLPALATSNMIVYEIITNPPLMEGARENFAKFFKVPVKDLKKFKFDGKDNMEALHKALGDKSSSEKGTELYYKAALKEGINEAKSVDDMIQDANKIKKELGVAKKELRKNKTETNKSKVAAKEEQLRRVAKAIRNARASQHESVNETKFVVFKGKKILGFTPNKIQARKAAGKWKAEYMGVEDYKKKYGEIDVKESVNEGTSFVDLLKAAKKKYGRKVSGDKRAFAVPYKYGEMSMQPTKDGRVDITWWSGGDSQDTDVYDIDKAMSFIMNESINEASKKSVTKIANEMQKVADEMKSIVGSFGRAKKANATNDMKKYVEQLKKLTKQKKALEKDLDASVKGLDANAELVANEHVLRSLVRNNIRENVK